MGAADSRSVSYGLDERDNVTVLHGVKLSGEVLQRMRDSAPASSKPEKAAVDPGPSRSSAAETQEELRKRFEREQALVQDELSRISQRERDAAAGDDLNPAVLRERARTRQELEKSHNLPDELSLRSRQLKRKEQEITHLEHFYKEQLQTMEKKNADFYQQTLHMYEQEAVKAEAAVRPRHVTPVCPELQSQVLSCYRLNPDQTLLCSQIARDYMNCINSSKKNLLVNHG